MTEYLSEQPRQGGSGRAKVAKKLYIKTQGCQMNEYDSSRMADLMRSRHGYELVDNPAAADVLLLNTCSIREKAELTVRKRLQYFNHLKDQKPHLLIGVLGCMAERLTQKLRTREL